MRYIRHYTASNGKFQKYVQQNVTTYINVAWKTNNKNLFWKITMKFVKTKAVLYWTLNCFISASIYN